jgi:hypothetical protein
VQQGLRGAGIPNREAYEDLLFRVEQLEHRVRLLENRSPEAQVHPEAPPEASVPPEEVEPTIPPVGGVDTAPEPPRDEPDTPPGLPPRT